MVTDVADIAYATRNLDCAIFTLRTWATKTLGRSVPRLEKLPRVSEAKRHASLSEGSFGFSQIPKEHLQNESERTFLYLAYGSNLCAATFQGKRQIKPLAQTNVVVPAISLTFDLPGIPYTEPCFGNCAYREQEEDPSSIHSKDYHKDRWHKGLVGVVYEVTAADYAHIIATEGGGSGYKDILVDCYELTEDPSMEVPLTPTTTAFKAHTLFSPPTTRSRADHSYAQPSARYKKLITDGANEHNLPYEYQEFLSNVRTYRITTLGQRMGQILFSVFWLPLMGLVFGLGKLLVGKDGTYPKWFARLLTTIFAAVWISYDSFFQPTFGDGERTVGDDTVITSNHDHGMQSEKRPLLRCRVKDCLDKTRNNLNGDDNIV